MCPVFCFLFLPIIIWASPLPNGCQEDGSTTNCSSELDPTQDIFTPTSETAVKNNRVEVWMENVYDDERKEKNESKLNFPTSQTTAQNKMIEAWMQNAIDDQRKEKEDRTWRLNRKALVPILIGLGIKAVSMIFIALSALTVIGNASIFVSKVSLVISIVMLLKKFLGHGKLPEGYAGHPSPGQDHHDKYTGSGNRKTIYVIRGRSHPHFSDALQHIQAFQSESKASFPEDFLSHREELSKNHTQEDLTTDNPHQELTTRLPRENLPENHPHKDLSKDRSQEDQVIDLPYEDLSKSRPLKDHDPTSLNKHL